MGWVGDVIRRFCVGLGLDVGVLMKEDFGRLALLSGFELGPKRGVEMSKLGSTVASLPAIALATKCFATSIVLARIFLKAF